MTKKNMTKKEIKIGFMTCDTTNLEEVLDTLKKGVEEVSKEKKESSCGIKSKITLPIKSNSAFLPCLLADAKAYFYFFYDGVGEKTEYTLYVKITGNVVTNDDKVLHPTFEYMPINAVFDSICSDEPLKETTVEGATKLYANVQDFFDENLESFEGFVKEALDTLYYYGNASMSEVRFEDSLLTLEDMFTIWTKIEDYEKLMTGVKPD